MTESREYPAVNLRNPMMIFWFLVFITFSSFMIWLAFVITNVWLTCLFSIFSLLTPFMIYYSLKTKVIIENNQIVKKSPFRTKTMSFNNIKSFGVYKQEGKFARVINRDEFDKKDWFGQNFIFIANRKGYSPMSFRQKGSIRFHYFKELYRIIENEIKASK